MSKNKITLIIVLMSIASLGLMGFQYYWVRNAIRINQERFDQEVYQALSGTVDQLEKGETSDVLLSQLIRDPALKESLFEKIDPIEVQIRPRTRYRNGPSIIDTLKIETVPQVSQTFKRILESRGLDMSIMAELETFFTYMTPEVASSIFTPDEMAILLEEKERQLQYLSRVDVSPFQRQARPRMDEEQVNEINISEDALEKIKKTNLKIDLMNKAWEEMAEGQRAILDRLDTSQVRKLVKNHLLERGITEDFELGLLNDDGLLISIGKVFEPFRLVQYGVQAKLFPNDILGKDNYLYIFFPEKDNHVLRQVWLPISSSLVFIGVIIFCFVYLIQVILRQKALSDIKNDFINNMTHEFKTPLATVSLAVEALQDPDLSTQDKFRTRYLGIIKDENKRLVSQVENVLQAAALDKKDFKLKIEEIDLSELLENTVEHISLQIEKRNGSITLENNMLDGKIEGDNFHLNHILNNLLDNANKYSPENPEIEIKAWDDQAQVFISIQDHGIGMNKDAQRKIFDKFYRVPTGNLHDVKGFGLGLSYVKTMLEAHKGDISVQSEPGKGSIFTIKLPKRQ
ncbi:HAMP domain-containing sensor histidine kinase [Algoriphagus sp. CAU 1675]|uniref:sensor histidine kinase n=1 Tax=Algoriphagus sp. CAU 1675 TaxID=3032597 RepID=UPI0023DBA086|nr:HAMP domain-containing sensor histidine kinase [Algoriphagus sp. CAU 1675]MDF2156591.1 HAMP domain-containing sensor histidine kinase [Algoriphagus sp. CAU 1675]